MQHARRPVSLLQQCDPFFESASLDCMRSGHSRGKDSHRVWYVYAYCCHDDLGTVKGKSRIA